MRGFAFVLVAGVMGVACSSSNGKTDGGTTDAGRDAATTDAGGDAAAEAGPPQVCMSDAGAPSASEFAGVPSCTAHSCVLAGTLNGGSVIQDFSSTNFSLKSGSFDVDFGGGGHVQLTFSGSLADNTPTNAQGTFLTPSDWSYAPAPSTTVCAGDGTRIMTVGQDGGATQVEFILRCMVGSCDGGAGIDGDLYGCCMQ